MKPLALSSTALGLLFLWFSVGWAPIVEALYRHHLWPRASAQEVEDALNQRDSQVRYECEDGTAGWDYICHGAHQMLHGIVQRVKQGGVGHPLTTIPFLTPLPVDGPTPSRDEYLDEYHRGILNEQRRLAARTDLNRARIDQLEGLPGVDRALAHRIAVAVIQRPFRTVDDLLRVEGVSQQMLENIRPLIRVDPMIDYRSSARASAPPTREVRATAVSTRKPESTPPTKVAPKMVQTKRRGGGFDDYQIPVGSSLTLRMRTTIDSASSFVGDQIRAELPDAVNRDNWELIPAGSLVHGKVVDVVRASTREPRGRIGIAFYVIEHARTHSRASIQTRSLVFEAPGLDEDRSRRPSKKQPRNVRLAAGESLALTLAKPLTVRIPR